MRNIEQEDLDANAARFQQQSALLLPRFALETNRELIPPDKYRELMRGLNTKQRQAHRRWCKDASSHTVSFLVVLVESYVISLIHRHCEPVAPFWAS